MDQSPSEASRKRNQTACEACRASKLRCVPSEKHGICQKCLISKRECVSRAGPRIRRSRRSKFSSSSSNDARLSPPPKPSGTFSIDFAVPSRQDVDESFETLRSSHITFMDSIFPESSHAAAKARLMSETASPAASSSTHSHSLQDMHAKPTFNLVSAQSLLDSFRSMLAFCPFIVLPPDATVSHLSTTRPFVLLAILAAASGSRTLQGHNLYDEEFRKVLALKMVAGGEQSLELLQGILVYCIWYPFHLRPKNKQVFQYTRMAADLVHDLDLDLDLRIDNPQLDGEITPEQIDGMRAYAAQYYLSSAFAVTWQSNRSGTAVFTDWTAHCCDVLEQRSSVPSDAVLGNLARLGKTVCDAWSALRSGNTDPGAQNSLVLLGLESQFNDQQSSMHPDVAATIPVQLQSIFTKFFLSGGPLLRLPRPRNTHSRQNQNSPSSSSDLPHPPTAKLHACIDSIRQFLARVSSLPDETLSHFSASDWGRLVLTVVAAMRLSFPHTEISGFDSAAVRSELDFGAFLDKMAAADADLTPATRRVDIGSAIRVVLGVVRDKYRERLAQMDAGLQPQSSQQRKAGSGCPMLDGSMDEFVPLWDAGSFVVPTASVFEAGLGEGQPLYGDEWAALAMGWAGLERVEDGMDML